MNLKPGSELIISLEGDKKPFKSFFVGQKIDTHIVASLPDKFPVSDKNMAKGKDASIRYSEDESIYEFRTKILEILKEPTDLIILEYPSEINPVEQRSRKRINCLVEAKFEIRFENNNRLGTGVIDNISKTGCNCIFRNLDGVVQPFSLGDTIALRCQFPGFPGEQTAEGKIIRLQEKKDEIHAGIRFDKEMWWIPPYNAGQEDNAGLK